MYKELFTSAWVPSRQRSTRPAIEPAFDEENLWEPQLVFMKAESSRPSQYLKALAFWDDLHCTTALQGHPNLPLATKRFEKA